MFAAWAHRVDGRGAVERDLRQLLGTARAVVQGLLFRDAGRRNGGDKHTAVASTRRWQAHGKAVEVGGRWSVSDHGGHERERREEGGDMR